MATTVSVNCDPEQSWQQQALSQLFQTFGQPIALWTFRPSRGWICHEQIGSCEESLWTDSCIDLSSLEWSTLIEEAATTGTPAASELASGETLLAMPIDARAVLAMTVRSDKLDSSLNMAHLACRYFGQQEELSRLREENEYFLKQVSDDFEELTFLRSMAERLGLGDSTHSVEQLVTASLPELGKSAHAEELFFLCNVRPEPQVLATWTAEGITQPLEQDQVRALLDRLSATMDVRQPLIKNGFDVTPLGQDFHGVRDIILVPAGETATPLGWFLAINRLPEDQDDALNFPEWRLNQHEFGSSEASLLSTAAAMISSHANNLSLFEEREVLLVNVVRTLVSAVEAKDQYTCGHSERVALYAKRLASELGYNEQACQLLYLTGLLHDVGKIAINDAILNKPDSLTDEEFAEIQRHPEEGWRILQSLEQLSYVLPGVLHHHERIDGKGYPDKLRGDNIPLDGRVLAVADAYDAMTSNRAYRTGMSHEKAIAILRDGAGTQWDGEAIEAFLAIEAEITTIRRDYQPREKPSRLPTAPDAVATK